MTSCLSDTLEYYKENAEAFVSGIGVDTED